MSKRPHYTIVCKGKPDVAIQPSYYSLVSAIVAAVHCPGSGDCVAAQILRCDSRDAAKSATYGKIRHMHERLVLEFNEPLARRAGGFR